MQRGHLYQAHGAWHLRYRVNGKQVSVKLADYNDEYRTLKSVRPLGEPYLQTANSGQQARNSASTASFSNVSRRQVCPNAAAPSFVDFGERTRGMLKTGIFNPPINSLLSRVRYTNLLVIADRGFPYWPMIETVDLAGG